MEIIEGMPYEEYAKRPGVNASLLKIVHKKSLQHARAYMDGTWAEESDALDFGKCFHSLALEGREDFVEIPANYTNEKGEEKPWNWNANVCKDWGKAQGDKIPLKAGEVVACRSMAEAVRRSIGEPKGRIEVSLFAEIKGHPFKCRVDYLPDDHSQPIVDLKSCQSAEPGKFIRNSIELGYHLQAALTLDVVHACGLAHKQFDLLAVESEAPHATCRMQFSDDHLTALRIGRIHYRAAFQRLLEAQETGRWFGYGTVAAEEFLPVWMKQELEQTA